MPKKSSRKISKGKEKEEIYQLITKIADEHCRSNKKFGYLDKNDIKNEIWVICLERLEDFKKSRGELENFLRTVVKNRLINRFKDITKSVKSPCPKCPFYNSEKDKCNQFGEEKHLCDKWHNYELCVQSRNSLLNASEPQIERQIESNTLNKLYSSELIKIIKDHLDDRFSNDFNILISGGKISKQKIKKLKKEIFRILEENDYENPNFVQINVKR